jgi:hypothetical protein
MSRLLGKASFQRGEKGYALRYVLTKEVIDTFINKKVAYDEKKKYEKWGDEVEVVEI